MANKYIIHGATYCGDGTSSAVASSNGGVGAWNEINVFEGTAPAYGTAPAAGDVVYIRSKTSAGADITRTVSANISLGSASGTVASPISWILDAGTIWSGISGTLKYYNTTGNYKVTCLGSNYIAADVQDSLVFECTESWPGVEYVRVAGWVKNAKFICSDTNSGFPFVSAFSTNSATPAVLENPHFVLARCGATRIRVENATALRLLNPDIELTSTQTGQLIIGLVSDYGPPGLEIYGGRVRGAGATSVSTLFKLNDVNYASIRVVVYGLDIPRSMPVCDTGITRNGKVEIVGLDGGIGSHLEEAWGFATSRTDNNPPTLSGQLPNSTLTPWAWRIYPRAADPQKPVRLPAAKIYTDSAATKTIALEFLVASTMAPTKRHAWITVEYTDNSTGLPKHVSTFDPSGGALDTSTADWSSSTWGMITLNKKKCSITTPTSVKQDTTIFVTFWFAMTSSGDQDILFLDHDFSIA